MMKRNIRSHRMIAVILTLAMAFTLLAVPASAASVTEEQARNAKAIVASNSIRTADGTEVKRIMTKKFEEELFKKLSENVDDTTLDWLWILTVQSGYEDGSSEIYNGSVPSDAGMGFMRVSDGKVIWLSMEDIENVTKINPNIDFSSGEVEAYNWNKGTMTISGQEFGIPNEDNTLLIVGGVVVAAGVATAVYFYTHPEIWQKTVNAVQTAWNNVTTGVQNTWNKITGNAPAEEALAEENAAAESTEQTQAAA